MTVKVRYKEPDGDQSKLFELPVTDASRKLAESDRDFQFAVSVAGFGMLLRGSPNAADLTWDGVRRLALAGKGEDEQGWRGEFIQLIEKARGLGESGAERKARQRVFSDGRIVQHPTRTRHVPHPWTTRQRPLRQAPRHHPPRHAPRRRRRHAGPDAEHHLPRPGRSRRSSGTQARPAGARPRASSWSTSRAARSHLDLWDPKENVPDNVRSAFKTIPTKIPGIHFTEILPKLAQVNDKFTMIRSMSYTPNGLFNHTAAIYQMMTGYTTDKVSPSGQLEPPNAEGFPELRLATSSA